MTALRVVPLLALLAASVPAGASAQSSDPHVLFAAERSVAGGDAWSGIAGLREMGTQSSGGASGAFVQIVDRRSGYSRTSLDTGPLHDVSGFDGTSWDAQNGIVSQADLPGIIADGVTTAYMARDGWWDPADPAAMTLLAPGTLDGRPVDIVRVVPRGGSAVDAWLDRGTHLLVRTVQQTDEGAVTTDYSDYRSTEGLRIPYRTVSIDPTNARTEITTASCDVLRPPSTPDVARPVSRIEAAFIGAPPSVVPFVFGDVDRGHIVVPALFSGKPASVIFDSGGANYLIPAAARRMGFTTGGGASISGVGNASEDASFARVGEIGLGTTRLRDQLALVAPLPYVVRHLRAGIEPDGLLGFETLSAFRVTVDYAARTLTLAPFDATAPSGTTVPFLSEGRHAYIPVTVDGATGLFGLDTGDSGGITVFRSFARDHRIFSAPGLPYVSAGGVGGMVSHALYRASAVTIAGTALAAPVVSVSDASAGAFASKAIAGNIGAGILRRFRVTFDFRSRTITFVQNASVHDRFPADRIGLSFTQTDPNAFVVLSVVPQSPAGAAGIGPGDRIVTVDGRSIAAQRLGLGDLAPILIDRVRPLPLTILRGTTDVTVVLTPRELL